MDDNARAEANKLWETLKADMETLAATITTYYGAVGSSRQCRHINELWHPEMATVGIGFVPPEAKDRLETLIIQSGLRLNKSNGPLGKAVYFSFVYDAMMHARLMKLNDALVKELVTLKVSPPPPPITAAASMELAVEEQVARVEGLHAVRGDKLRTRPPEIVAFVDGFNNAVAGMNAAQTLKLLADAVPYLNLPDISRHELIRTVEMMRDAENS